MRSPYSLNLLKKAAFSTFFGAMLAGHCSPTWAQAPQSLNPFRGLDKASANDAPALLRLSRAQRASRLPLTLKVESASVEEIVAQIQKKLSLSPQFVSNTPRIEVRDVKPVKLSFATKDSTVGSTLGSVAILAGVKYWTFADCLLLAPETALTPAEEEALTKFQGNAWHSVDFFQEQMYNSGKQKALASFVAKELGVAPPNGNKNGPDGPRAFATSPNDLLGHSNWGQLTPEVQGMVKELVDMSKEWLDAKRDFGGNFPKLDLSTAVVGINPKDNNSLTVFFSDTAQLCWQLNGLGSGVVAPRSKSPAPLLDPSADKS